MKVELDTIHKHFGPVRANDGITVTFASGEIHGLLGENGAGKSTLMKVLSGFISADSGTISLDGTSVTFNSPADAIRQGVGMLHQDPLDVPPLRLLDNFIMGRDNRILQNRTEARSAFVSLCKQFDFNLDPNAFVYDLSVGERQQLEIVRLLWLGVRALILDEPTTGISAPQKVKLFATLKRLAADGLTIIFVSHKLEDVEVLCERVTVLSQGKLTGAADAPFSAAKLVEMMFGKPIKPERRPDAELGAPLLQLRNVSLNDLRLSMPNIELSVQAGEVIGIAGLEGSGQRLLMLACAGLMRARKGTIHINGDDLTNASYRGYLDAGVTFMPADRMEEGLIPGLTITEHFMLTKKRAKGSGRRLDWRAASESALANIKKYNIKGTPSSTVESLSGGNQQRALLALLHDNLNLLIMEHPTRGLDVESALSIWERLLARRSDGTAILFSSADLDEIFQYSDRILVCYGGEITAIVNTSETSVAELGHLIAGKRASEVEVVA